MINSPASSASSVNWSRYFTRCAMCRILFAPSRKTPFSMPLQARNTIRTKELSFGLSNISIAHTDWHAQSSGKPSRCRTADYVCRAALSLIESRGDESLLAHHESAASFIETPAFASAQEATMQESPAARSGLTAHLVTGTLIGHYRVLEESCLSKRIRRDFDWSTAGILSSLAEPAGSHGERRAFSPVGLFRRSGGRDRPLCREGPCRSDRARTTRNKKSCLTGFHNLSFWGPRCQTARRSHIDAASHPFLPFEYPPARQP